MVDIKRAATKKEENVEKVVEKTKVVVKKEGAGVSKKKKENPKRKESSSTSLQQEKSSKKKTLASLVDVVEEEGGEEQSSSPSPKKAKPRAKTVKFSDKGAKEGVSSMEKTEELSNEGNETDTTVPIDLPPLIRPIDSASVAENLNVASDVVSNVDPEKKEIDIAYKRKRVLKNDGGNKKKKEEKPTKERKQNSAKERDLQAKKAKNAMV